MTKLKVLIADDSVVYRSQIRAALDLDFVEIVGAAANGRLAIEKMRQTAVDLLILDLEMPEMDGIQTLKEISNLKLHCKVVVFSSLSKRGAEITFEALRLGASDFITKPGNPDVNDLDSSANPSLKIRSLLEPRIRALYAERQAILPDRTSTLVARQFPTVIWDLFQPQVVVIGSSTGGPTILEQIFSNIGPPLRCPIFIAQHMPRVFTATLAERLQRISGLKVKEGSHGELVSADTVYIAPGDFHMRLHGPKDQLRIQLDQDPQINSVRPAVDPLFESAAEVFKDKCLGYVLTGMGADGKVGAEHIKENGGTVVIQSEASCVVFGMPGAVMTTGAYDKVMNPAEIISSLQEKVVGSKVVGSPQSAVGGK